MWLTKSLVAIMYLILACPLYNSCQWIMETIELHEAAGTFYFSFSEISATIVFRSDGNEKVVCRYLFQKKCWSKFINYFITKSINLNPLSSGKWERNCHFISRYSKTAIFDEWVAKTLYLPLIPSHSSNMPNTTCE